MNKYLFAVTYSYEVEAKTEQEAKDILDTNELSLKTFDRDVLFCGEAL